MLLCAVVAPAGAETPVTGKTPAGQSTQDAIKTVEAELAAAREKLAAGPSGSLITMMAESIATRDEQDEWTLLLNLRIASLEKHLDALRNLGFEIDSRQETQARADAWTGFTQPAPYTIDFIDDLWGDLIARQQDIEALQIGMNLASTQFDELKHTLEKQQSAGRLAAEQAQQSRRSTAPEQARLTWLNELAGERIQTTLTTLAQYDAILRYYHETLSHQQLKVELLHRQIDVATAASPLTQEELDRKLALLKTKRVALETELAEAVVQEQKAQGEVNTVRAELKQLQADAVAGNAADKGRIEFAQAMLEVRKAQAETVILRLEVLRLLLDISLGADRIWHARFEVAHDPGLARLREMRAHIVDVKQHVDLWRRYLANSLDAVVSLMVSAEKRQAGSGRDALERTIAEAMVDAYRQRKALYERFQTEINQVQLLLLRWEQEVLAKDRDVSRDERVKDLLVRLAGEAAEIWNLEVFTVKDTIVVEGREMTGSSSITVGKITTVLLILTLGLWLASLASMQFSLQMRKRFDMNKTAATLLERGLYILSVVVLILLALDIVNIPLTVFAFLGGALAIGIGFGAQTLINNFISGLILLIERPISLGDLVEVEGVRGRVGNIGARCSRIRRADGIDMLVPNSAFLEKNVTNLTLTDTQLRVSVKIGVAYGSSLREVTRALQQAVEEHGQVLKDPAPLILFEDFGDNALMFAVEFWVNVSAQTDSRVVASDLRHMIERLFREAGIVIAYPQRDVHLDQTRPLEVVMRPYDTASEPATGS
jgi:small-conductance mechanosensitive channel